ncbi:P-loop NTPase fold protein [Sphingopyxis sp. R3-92]|uniref:P-loop NTPase fold protein n=1 Tax=Sphingopyxis sp. R3-92 TaxID=3158553 RepID=UPI003EE59DCD
MDETAGAPNDPNHHIRDYLAHFLGLAHAPHYAVMLSGRWGIGKTFQVKKIVSELLAESGKRYVLMSLYGLKSPQEIDDAMVAALYPWTNNDGVRIASAVGKAILKHAKIELPKIQSGDLVSRMSADVFIFDDLERCRMSVTDALGYINQLVERDGCKVIILANEDEIRELDDYVAGKEKLIGKTLELDLDFDAAFTSFLSKISDHGSRTLFERFSPDIRAIHEYSNFKNLRILQQTMWDFERLYKIIGPEYRNSQEAMGHLLKLFFVLSFEYKAGALSSDELSRRTGSWLRLGLDKEKPSPLTVASTKYPGLHIYDSMLPDEVAVNVLVKGVIDALEIEAALNASSWFATDNEPSWRTVWRSTELADTQVEAAAIVMQSEFSARKYDISGEILHLFGQMLFLADIGVSGRSRTEIVGDCKAYVDDLMSQGRLERPREAYLDDIRHGSFGGLGFAQNDTPEFRELWAYLAKMRSEAEVSAYSVNATSLIDLMKADPSEFVNQITYGREGGGEFANRPVLAASDPILFAESLIGLDPKSYREVLLGLSSRYDMARLAANRELAQERPWAEKLERAILDKASRMGAFARDRLSKNLIWTLGKELEELRKADAE